MIYLINKFLRKLGKPKPKVSMKDITVEDIILTFNVKKYELVKANHYPNLFGIRSSTQEVNVFNDKIGAIVYVNDIPKLYMYDGTTDPGLYWLKNPMRKEGTIILCLGHYKDAYKIGTHKGYKAYEQVGQMQYVRDNNKDEYIDMTLLSNPKKKFWAIAATNLHRASAIAKSTIVDKWSAGCQVVAAYNDYSVLLGLGIEADGMYNIADTFNYSLFSEEEIVPVNPFR